MRRWKLQTVGMLIGVVILWLQQEACTVVVVSIEFEHGSFDSKEDLADMEFVEESSWYTGTSPALKHKAIWLTPDPRDHPNTSSSNLGRVIYKAPIQFLNTRSQSLSTMASFNTSFSFQIITTAPYKLMGGSGMTFFISDSPKSPNNSGAGFLGLVDYTAAPGASHFFAIEFDTRASPAFKESSASHIGIDINSLLSVNITDTSPGSRSSFYPELFLYNNYTFTAWIEYDALTALIQVWMTNATSPQHRPSKPCLQTYYNLSDVFKDFMYVGFTATNDPTKNSIEGYALYSWSFSSDDFPFSTSKGETTSPSKGKSSLTIVLPIAIFFALGLCCAVCIFIVKRRKRNMKALTNIGKDMGKAYALGLMPSSYTYTELNTATSDFDMHNKIGAGGSSLVYRGALADGSIIAVKKLKGGMRGRKEFMSEMKIISRIRHRNLLNLQGWCYEKGEALLVYKYMSNGSLDTYLFGQKSGTLRSETRLKILVGVASALEYLHGGLQDCVVHRDVKAANVLLTDELEPILGDFGLSRLIKHNKVVTMTIAGTLGYVAPEVLSRGKATDKADVYSFGILALEVACGRSANAAIIYPSSTKLLELSLLDWVWMLHQNEELIEALDTSLMREDLPASQKEQWRCVLLVALMCCNALSEARPTMRQVSQALQGDTLLLPISGTSLYRPCSSRSHSGRSSAKLCQFNEALQLPSSDSFNPSQDY